MNRLVKRVLRCPTVPECIPVSYLFICQPLHSKSVQYKIYLQRLSGIQGHACATLVLFKNLNYLHICKYCKIRN